MMMDKYIKEIEEKVLALRDELETLANNIHDNPELGMEEFKACKWQCDLLKKYRFSVEEGFCGMSTAFDAVYRGNAAGPKIGMLSEYDALPELGHGCGHNLIAMMAVGSGIIIKDYVEQFGGEIHVIGTPAEETDCGKVNMCEAGVFDDFDVIMMAHPFEDDASSMNTMALACRVYEFFGKSSHAAQAPEAGRNALDAMLNFFNMINALRQQVKDDARIHGVITHGGLAPNIIPDYTRAKFYIRANTCAYVKELEEKVQACAEGAALGSGTTVKITPAEHDVKDLNTNMYLNELICQQLEKVGHIIPRKGMEVLCNSSDIGDVSYACPSVQMCCGMGPMEDGKRYEAHTLEFEKMAGTEQAFSNGLDYVKGFSMTAVELLKNPEHLKKIKEEFMK